MTLLLCFCFVFVFFVFWGVGVEIKKKDWHPEDVCELDERCFCLFRRFYTRDYLIKRGVHGLRVSGALIISSAFAFGSAYRAQI